MSKAEPNPRPEDRPMTYRDAGVDVDAGEALVQRIKGIAAATHGPEVAAGVGGFASLFRLPAVGQASLAASCDGVGTKLKVAFATNKHDTVGIDLVAMNVNDLICAGADPMFFLDYLATGHLEVDTAADVIRGVAEGCRQAGCALVGGETAEMPDMYAPGEYDLAGFAVGLVPEGRALTGERVEAGDTVIGLFSTGLHSNGYSLARKVLIEEPGDLGRELPELGRTLAEELLEPTRIYVQDIRKLRESVDVRALVHVTGGGLVDNPPRCVPESLAWRLDCSRWEVPPVMSLIARRARLPVEQMRRTFNMGLGMLAVVPAAQAAAALRVCEKNAGLVGEIIPRRGLAVEFVG